MSNSRLEKFIYAICGMEVDDLPTPLSRIETLWNCLITGEMPDFEPLSRNEKYLMAMLTDDVDGLPEPTSRSEKLLYKIATGETDLSDVPGYLSRYEELLKQLIESGGIGGTDFEYVLYTLNDSFSTLYSTAEAPVESAILSGKTKLLDSLNNEVNEPNHPNIIQGYYLDVSTGQLISASTSRITEHFIECPNMPFKIRGDNKYKRIVFYDENKSFISGKEWKASANNDEVISNIPENAKYIKISFSISVDDTTTYTPSTKIELLDNDENNLYLTHLESVKLPVLTTTGKNQWIEQDFMKHTSNSSVLTNTDNGFIIEHPNQISEFIKTYINLKKGTWTISFDVEKTDTSPAWVFLQKEDVYGENITKNVSIQNGRFSITYTSSSDIENACLFFDLRHQGTVTISNIQLEQGSTATSYEPYKTNILTTTSKNLFDMNRPYDAITDSQATVVQDTNQITVSSSAESGIYVNANFILDKDFFAGKTVTGSCLYESDEKDIGTVQITYQDGNGEHHYQWIKTPKTFTFPNSFIGDVMLSVSANNTGTPQSNTVTVKNIQLELGSTATPYEPYSEVVLRGIGDVKDTHDGNTGELTQRIGELVITDNTPSKGIRVTDSGVVQVNIPISVFNTGNGTTSKDNICCDKFTWSEANILNPQEGLRVNGNTLHWAVSISKLSSTDLIGVNNYLKNNPITVQYELAEPTVKTVGLSITDQDGQPTKLSTFNDTTHVSIEAEDLLPTVDLEVPTKIEETLSTLPTLMNDISETQQLLNESIDEQAEDINEVSTAITEIRNDIL